MKGAQKAEVPHVEEHVSRIEYVGVQTQHKLQVWGSFVCVLIHQGCFLALLISCCTDLFLRSRLLQI